MKIALGSDKSGYPLRNAIQAHLKDRGEDVVIVEGPQSSEEAVPFFEVAPKIAKAVQRGDAHCGVLICGTGMGMSQVANKFKGIRAACVETLYGAKMCKVINDSNVLCMGGWMIAPELGAAMVDQFLDNEFVGGVEPWRKEWLINAKEQVSAIEDKVFCTDDK